MTVSVIMTCHDEEGYIEQAIHSVVSQTAYDQVCEIIVVNDGSRDNSQIVLDKLSAEISKLRVIKKPGVGVSAARNSALQEARGDYIAILDGDDYWAPEKLKHQLPAFAQSPLIGLVYCDFIDFSMDGAKDCRYLTVRRYNVDSSHHLRDYFIHDGPIIASTVLIRRTVFFNVGIFDKSLRVCEDTEFFLRLAEKWRFCYVPGAFLFKRRRRGQLTQNLSALLPNATLVTRRFVERNPELAVFASRRLSRLHVKISIDYGQRGDRFYAARHALNAIRMAPFYWRAWVNMLLILLPIRLMLPFYGGVKRLYHIARRSTAF